MAKLTKAQINQIKAIIKDHMEVLVQLLVGDGKPSPALVKKLGLPKQISDLITDAYKYGKLNIIRGKNLANMSKNEVDALLRNLTLSKSQQLAIDYLKTKTQIQLDNITQRLTTSVLTTVIQNDLSLWSTVKDVIPQAMENKLPRYQVIQQLREKSGDMERDWHRVAHSEMWDAKVNGEAQAILNNESPLSNKGKDTLVFKRPAENACNKCKQLYLMPNSKVPRVFKLSELMANGTNYNRKTADWVATLGIIHPNCMCPLSVMPDGFKFDDEGNLVPDFQ